MDKIPNLPPKANAPANPPNEAHFKGRNVVQGKAEQPIVQQSASNTWMGAINSSVRFWSRKISATVGIYRPKLPDFSGPESNDVKMRSLGAYLNECKELRTEPQLAEDDNLYDLAESLVAIQPSELDPDSQMGYWALECFYGDTSIINPTLTGIKQVEHIIKESPDIRYAWELDNYFLGNIDSVISTTEPHLSKAEKLERIKNIGVTLTYELLTDEQSFTSPQTRGHRMFILAFVGGCINNPNLLGSSNEEERTVKSFLNDLNNLRKLKDNIQEIKNNIETILSKLNAHEEISEQEKITRGDLFLLSSLLVQHQEAEQKMRDSLSRIVELEGDFSPKIITELLSIPREDIVSLLQELDSKLIESLDLRSGDILQYRSSGVSQLFAQNQHAETIIIREAKPHISGIVNEYRLTDFPLLWSIASDFYAFSPTALIDKKHHEVLKKLYGSDWSAIIEDNFEKIEENFHSEKFFSPQKLRFSPRHFEKAATVSVFKGFSPVKLARQTPRARDSSYEKVIIGKYATQKKRMICSAFVARSTEAALYALNLEILADLKRANIHVPKNTVIVNSPFNPNEKFGLMSPDRLNQILIGKGCLSKIDSTLMKDIFKQD